MFFWAAVGLFVVAHAFETTRICPLDLFRNIACSLAAWGFL